jgi:hypothetical protein
MDKKDPPKNPPIIKNIGVTPSEKYLGKLCNKTFLLLWSYPGIYQDKGKSDEKGHGKEVCDLLVVFGEHIIIFSDKDCTLPDTGDLVLDWKRWFKRAIIKSANQAWGAERWISQYSSRVYLDRECSVPIPIDIPTIENAVFHLVVVAHGVSERIKELYKGSGSLMIDSSLKGFANHDKPFTIGDVDPSKTFIHVLDDDSLDTLMSTRNTISDFVDYLQKRELLIRNERKIVSPGEEELLAIFLTKMNEEQRHDFNFPNTFIEKDDSINLKKGIWDTFEKDARRIAQKEHDKVSYTWDKLIDQFCYHAMEGNQYFVTPGGIKDTERILSFMASEPRVIRRVLSQALVDMIETTHNDQRKLRILDPLGRSGTHYVFLLFPIPMDKTITNDTYREVRREFLWACCLVAKLEYPHAEDIIGIATESGRNSKGHSEDALYFNARLWNPELKKEALELQNEYKILKKPNYGLIHVKEFPDSD